jgi:steroid 5-alpha reductase family enzyme
MWYFTVSSGWDPRIMLMTVCITIWGIRLTFNFARKGGYQLKFWAGEEDYRWEVLRQNATFKGHPFRWRLFSFFFIAFYQNFLLWAITLPAILASGVHDGIGVSDLLIAFVLITLIIIETIADQQQWNYQTEKYRRKNAEGKPDGEYAIGFIRTGLFAYSRHPNYACEQLIWVVLYFFTISAMGAIVNWTSIGAILLLILFQGSADFSEKISASKYPAYKDYMRKVPMFLNRLW